jgi:hypothetical protein
VRPTHTHAKTQHLKTRASHVGGCGGSETVRQRDAQGGEAGRDKRRAPAGAGPCLPARPQGGRQAVARESDRRWREESGRTRTSALKGPLSSRGQRAKFYQIRVKSALKRDASPAHGRPRPELDMGLYSGHPSTGIRIWDWRSGPVVDGSGPRQDVPLGA